MPGPIWCWPTACPLSGPPGSWGTPLRERVTGSDLFPRICGLAARRGYRVYLLGGLDGVAEKAKGRFGGAISRPGDHRHLFPALRV